MTNIVHSISSPQLPRSPALAGTLADWSLVDIIQMIDLGKKTGAVVIHGYSDTLPIEGLIVFVEGAIHHARNGKRVGIEAMFELFTATAGSFRFTNIEEIPPRNIYLSNEHVIMEGIIRQTPSCPIPTDDTTDVFVRLVAVPNPTHATIVLTEEQWHLVTLIQGETSVNALAEHLQYTLTHVRKMVHDLIRMGLVEEHV